MEQLLCKFKNNSVVTEEIPSHQSLRGARLRNFVQEEDEWNFEGFSSSPLFCMNQTGSFELMKRINSYLLMIIGNYLEIEDVIRLSITWRKCHLVFKDYFEYYKKECKRLFWNNWNLFKNLFMDTKPSSTDIAKHANPSFICKGTATKIWRELTIEGLSLKNSWKNSKIKLGVFDRNLQQSLGTQLFEVLKSPELTVPALIKEDNSVDFDSVYSQYLYEYLFRMKNIYAGRRPAATFTFLSERELQIKQAFTQCLSNVDELAQEVIRNDESLIFLNLRWYWANPKYKFTANQKSIFYKENLDKPTSQFNSYYSSDSDSSTYASTQFRYHMAEMLKKPDIKSNLNLVLLLIFDTVTFYCRLANEVISEIQDELKFLQEYDKRWNAYVASMIKFDEILMPLSRIVNKVYKRVFPNYPACPQFSFLRFFITIWRREVYNLCKESIEDYVVKILFKFHKSCLAYSKEAHSLRKEKRKKTSLSDYFTSSIGKECASGGFRSMVSPMLSQIKLGPNDMKNSFEDMSMTDQDIERHSILDLEMMFGEEIETNLPNFDRSDKESLKQIIIDVIDLSLNEYSMHYICHSENEFLTPYNDLRSKIKGELFRFYKSSIERIPFKLWSEVIEDHCKILTAFLPITLQKEIYEYRISFVRKYTKNRIGVQLKGFTEKSKEAKKSKGKKSVQMFNTNSETHDPTLLTESEYLELTVAEFINTPFHDFLVSSFKKKQSYNNILSLLAYIKENEVDIMRVYNHNVEVDRKFNAELNFKNATILRYKEPKGFPLKLEKSESLLFSLEDGISLTDLEKIKIEKQIEKERKEAELKAKEDEFSNSFSIDTDSCEEEIPFAMDVDHVRMSNPEKRTSKFDSLCSLNLIKGFENKDANMENEEDKSEVSKEESSEVQSFGSMRSFIKQNVAANKNTLDSCPFLEASCEFPCLQMERKSNIDWNRNSLLSTTMLRFSDFEKMDDVDVDMDDMPEKLIFKRA